MRDTFLTLASSTNHLRVLPATNIQHGSIPNGTVEGYSDSNSTTTAVTSQAHFLRSTTMAPSVHQCASACHLWTCREELEGGTISSLDMTCRV